MSVTITELNGVQVNVRASYNYCGLCGHQPRNSQEEPNYAPLRWWDPDDGWKITTLCRHCHGDTLGRKPKADDFACARTNGVCDDENTDEDPLDAIT